MPGLRAYQGEKGLKGADEAIHNEKDFQFLDKGFCFFFWFLKNKNKNKKLFLYKIVNYKICYSIMFFLSVKWQQLSSPFPPPSPLSSERALIPAVVKNSNPSSMYGDQLEGHFSSPGKYDGARTRVPLKVWTAKSRFQKQLVISINRTHWFIECEEKGKKRSQE